MDLKAVTVEQLKSDLEATRDCIAVIEAFFADYAVERRHAGYQEKEAQRLGEATRECIAAIEAELAERENPKPAPDPGVPLCYTCGEAMAVLPVSDDPEADEGYCLMCTGASTKCLTGGVWPTEAEAIANYPRRDVIADLLTAARLGRATVGARLLGMSPGSPGYGAMSRRLSDIEAAIAKADDTKRRTK